MMLKFIRSDEQSVGEVCWKFQRKCNQRLEVCVVERTAMAANEGS